MMSDWADHLTTIFPEVRLKSFLEMRGRIAAHFFCTGDFFR